MSLWHQCRMDCPCISAGIDSPWQSSFIKHNSELKLFLSQSGPPVGYFVHGVYFMHGVFSQQPQRQEVHHDSFPGSRFSSAVSPGQLEKKIPSRPVSSSSLVLQPSLANVILPLYPLKRCWASCFP
jgi:hypothetical protein